MNGGNPQTRASMKYQEKVGLVAKSYKIKKALADEFAETCARLGVGQAATISGLMREFIDEHGGDGGDELNR